MNKLLSLALVGCFLISICYEWVFPGWDGYYLSKLTIIMTLSCILWIKFSYSELLCKSLAFIVFLDAVWNVGQFFMDGEHQGPLELLNGLIFFPWLFWAYFRSYQLKPSTILSGRAYFISGKPTNIWSFYLSLFGDPTGSKGVYINGKLYGYHNDKFKCRTLDVDKLNVLADEIKSKPGLEAYLHRMVNDKYSWKNNCLSLRLKVWWYVR